MKELRIKKIGERLHSQIKIRAIQEKKSMNDFVLETLQEKIDGKICRCKNEK